MGKLYLVAHDGEFLDSSLDASEILHVEVLSKNGAVIGSVSGVKLHPKTLKTLGVMVNRGFVRFYFGVSYIKRIGADSVLLTIDPSPLIEGKKVFMYNGKRMGRVKRVIRKGTTNDIKELVVASFLRKDIVVSASAIHLISKSVILSGHYHGKQKYFWQNSK